MAVSLETSIEKITSDLSKASSDLASARAWYRKLFSEAENSTKEEIEAVYNSGLASEMHVFSRWEDIESRLLNLFFAGPNAQHLDLPAIGRNMLHKVVGVDISVTGDLQRGHLGLGAKHSVIRLEGNVGCLGNQAFQSTFEHVGKAHSSTGANSFESRYLTIGYAQSLGHIASGSLFVHEGDVGYLLQGGKGCSAHVVGNVRNAAFAQARDCLATVDGDMLSSVFNHGQNNELRLTGSIEGQVYDGGQVIQIS